MNAAEAYDLLNKSTSIKGSLMRKKALQVLVQKAELGDRWRWAKASVSHGQDLCHEPGITLEDVAKYLAGILETMQMYEGRAKK
jgi:hypothetical protein